MPRQDYSQPILQASQGVQFWIRTVAGTAPRTPSVLVPWSRSLAPVGQLWDAQVAVGGVASDGLEVTVASGQTQGVFVRRHNVTPNKSDLLLLHLY